MTQTHQSPQKIIEVSAAYCCKLCNSPEPLHPCSHVIPQWMYKMLPIDARCMKIASSYAKEYEQKSQTGIYGKYVCKKCEDRLAAWDDYAATVLQRKPVVTAQGLDFGQYDYNRLARFFLSVLWRAHSCEHKFFDKVDLDSHTLSLTKCLLNDNAENLKNFDVIPTWSSNILTFAVMTPIKVLVESIPYWQLYLPLFQVLIKVVPRPGAACLQPIMMIESKNLCMIEKTFTEFNEIHIAERVFKENMKKKWEH